MRSKKQIVFDVYAILKWTQKEAGYQKVKSAMISCLDNSVTGYMNQINLGEIYYKTIRAVGIDEAKAFWQTSFDCP